MKRRFVLTAAGALFAWAVGAALQGQTAAGADKTLTTFALRYLPWDPESKITVERPAAGSTPAVAGFEAFKIHRAGRYSKLATDKTWYVSTDGHWVFTGDTLPNKDAAPARSSADLVWLSRYLSNLFRTSAIAALAPDRDQAGLKGVLVACETGFGRVRLPGYVTPDGRVFLQGALWDLKADPRVERRHKIDLSAARVTGPADAPVALVEYADMECGYCKFRGLQLDKLLETNAGNMAVRRHYKFFPLWLAHVWAMKAASAGDCLFRLSGPALFRFKQVVYSRQETLTVSGIDELAVTTAEAEGIPRADFLSCYLREESFGRVLRDMEEGYRLGVNSTPTYYIDGTEISWVEDKVMEDFLRTLFPKIKTISYEPLKK